MRSKFFITVAAVIIIGFIVFGVICLSRAHKHEPETIILISIDTIRADHLSCYGYKYPTTPNIDAFAQNACLFENCFADKPFTRPSHASMFTGVISPVHGVHDNEHIFSDMLPTLPEILTENGYSTYGIVSAEVLDKKYGLGRGFNVYYDKFAGETTSEIPASERAGNETAAHALKWLGENKDKKKFMFIHFFDPHMFYRPPAPYDKQFRNPYDGEIAFTDYCIGLILDKLKLLELYDDSLIVITGDHGEMLGEHDEETHGYYIYQNVLRVPLIVKPPGWRKGHKVNDNTTLLDISPTILAQSSVEIPSGMQGLDLSDYFVHRDTRITGRFIYNESLEPTKYNGNSLLGIINDKWHYIQTTRPELYNRIADPGELNNLIETEPKQAAFLKKYLRQILDDAARISKGSGIVVNYQSQQALESLGYISGVVDTDLTFNQTKPDPKDLIKVYGEIMSAVGFSKAGNYDKAIKLCRQVIQKHPDITPVYEVLANTYTKQKSYDKAIEILQKQLELLSKDIIGNQSRAIGHLSVTLKSVENAHSKLGNMFQKQAEFEEAISHYSKALQITPDSVGVLNNLAWIFATVDDEKLRDPAQAVRFGKRACELTGYKVPEVLDTLSIAYAADGDFAKAIEITEKVLELAIKKETLTNEIQENIDMTSKSVEDIHYRLGDLFRKQGKFDEAISHYSKALQITPDSVNMLNNLAWIFATVEDEKLRDPAQAVRFGKRACELTGYKVPQVLDTLSIAYASSSDFAKAIETAERALVLAVDNEELTKDIRKHMELYKANKPYYDK